MDVRRSSSGNALEDLEPPALDDHVVSEELPRRRFRDRLRLPLMVGVPVIAIAVALYWYFSGGEYQSTDDAYVRAAQVSISSNVSGTVVDIDVRDNQQVHRGQALFRIDPRSYQIAVDQTRAKLAGVRQQIEALKATYYQRLSDRRAAESALDYQEHEYQRQLALVPSGIASQALVERDLLSRNEARERVTAATQQIDAVLANLGGDPNLPVERNPAVEEAQSELDRALLNLSYTVISAPLDGVVTRVEQLQVGSYVNASAPVFSIISSRDVWVEANFKEVQLAHMRPGQSAVVRIDAFAGKEFKARVQSVSPGTGSEFSLLPPENATGNWVKVVQRLPVRLEFEDQFPAARTGLSASVTVDTQYHHGL